jgi:hypothetical protein
MKLPDLPKDKDGKKKTFQWIKKAAAQAAKSKSFSVVEGKKILKMLQTNGYTASALQVDGNGIFRVECALSSQPSETAVDNPWDEVI